MSVSNNRAPVLTNGPSNLKLCHFAGGLCAVACHGIPDLRPLREGDIISYDCTAYLNGFFGRLGGGDDTPLSGGGMTD